MGHPNSNIILNHLNNQGVYHGREREREREYSAKLRLLAVFFAIIAALFGVLAVTQEAHASTLTVKKIASESDLPAETDYPLIYLFDVSDTASNVTYTIGNNWGNYIKIVKNAKCKDTGACSKTHSIILRTKSAITYGDSLTIGGGTSDPAFTIYITKAGYTSDGEYVDLKISFNSFSLNQRDKANDYVDLLDTVDSVTDGIWMMSFRCSVVADVTCTFYYTGTTTKVSNNSFAWSCTDIDAPGQKTSSSGTKTKSYSDSYTEAVLFYSGFTNPVYISKNSYLSNVTKTTTSGNSYTKLTATTIDSDTFLSGFITRVTTGSFRFKWYGSICGTKLTFTDVNPGDPAIDSPVKTVDKEEAELGDTLTYTITETIPYTISSSLSGGEGNTYSEIVLTDTLDDAFDSSTVSVVIYREDTLNGVSKEVDTSNWTTKVSGQKVTITANDPADVGGNYTFVISAQLKEDADLSGYSTSGGYYLITNSATIQCGSYTMTSNTVTTNVEVVSTVTDTSYTERIISVTSSDDSIDYSFDGTAEEIYDGAPTSYPYEHTTSSSSHSEEWTVTAEIVTVEEIHTYKKNEASGETYDDEYTYNIVNTETVSRTFKYSTVMPTISQEKYTPLVLNRNDYATSEDIDSSYVEDADGEIQAEVNNKQDIDDNSDLTSLDINLNSSFYFAFTNSTFGLPDRYNWANTPDTLEEGSYELAGEEYANGKNDSADDDGYFRYNLKFYASISSLSSIDTASLVIDSDEYTSSSAFTKTYASDMNWRGGTMYARFIYQGLYTTDNNSSDSSFANWWVVTYSQGRFYEYGTSFEGSITVNTSKNSSAIASESGVQDATASHGTYTVNSTTKSGTDTIVIDANNEDRGLYVGLYLVNYEQPILYGHWGVSTLGGLFSVS